MVKKALALAAGSRTGFLILAVVTTVAGSGTYLAADRVSAAKVGDLTAGMWRRKASLLEPFAKLGLDAPSGQAEA
jgi:hypothetical protein